MISNLSQNLNWMHEADCRALSYDERSKYLYPVDKHTQETKEFIAKLCGGCPVQVDCLEYAIKNRIGKEQYVQTHIWGGLDYRGRVSFVRKRIAQGMKEARQ